MTKIFILLLSILTLKLSAQDIKFNNNFDEQDQHDAFVLLGLQNFKYEMPVAFKGYYFDFIVKEYIEGIEVSSVSQSTRYKNMKQVLQWRPDEKNYTMKIQSLKNDTVETFNVRLPGIGIRAIKLKLKSKRNDYEWQSLINEKTKLIADTEIPILSFSSGPSNPDRPNLIVHCELPDNNYINWYNNLKVKHFFVMLIKVTKQ